MPVRTQDTGGTDAVIQAAAEMTLKDKQPMARSGYGTKGARFPVQANAYLVKPPRIVCYHYDVRIEPSNPVTPPRLNKEIWRWLDQQGTFNGIAVAYDGRSMAYSPRELPADEGQWSITLPNEDGSTNGKGVRTFTVTIRYTRPIDLEKLTVFAKGTLRGTPEEPDANQVQSAIQALNVLIQHGPSMLYPNRAASFFLPPMDQGQASIARGICMWRGFYTSLRLGPEKLFVNLDLASQPMVQAGSLPHLVLNFLRGTNRNLSFAQLSARNIPGQEMIKLNRFLRGLKVRLNVRDKDGNKPTRKIKTLEAFSADDPAHSFDIDGKRYTVASYFQEFYRVTLRRPDFPVIRISKVGLWPIEVCDVEAGQKYSRKLDSEQTADAIRLTTVGPQVRLKELAEGLRCIQPGDAALKQWGIEINPEPIEAMARELPQPKIQYRRAVHPRNGVWDVRGQTLFNPTIIERWLILVFDKSTFFTLKDAQQCIVGLVAACQSMGIEIRDERPAIHYAPPGGDAAAFMRLKGSEMMQAEGNPPQLIICFLPRKPIDIYGDIKRFGDQQVGIATQCLFENKAKKSSPGYWSNVALKINVKMQGGINSILLPEDLGLVAEKPTVLGGDVSHASPGSLAPSVASIVGSMDASCSTYGSAITVQPSRLEIIARAEEMVLKLLKQFHAKHGFPPERLIFLRDGISEGQFSQVISTEVVAIRIACARFNPDYKPALTFICCGKRHKMSFFPKDRAHADPKTGNVKSGTVIDTEVVSPFNFDFYLNAHQGLLGTARSAHYIVLVDDSQFTADQLQSLVFNLCYTYARATRSVSVATPAFYASRLCTRAQLLLRREDDDTTTQYSSTSHSSEERLREQALSQCTERLRAIHPNHAETLFYM
ncbi:hypothetical protein JCM10449v2_006100 [Rhodotorula kratochvilovae]